MVGVVRRGCATRRYLSPPGPDPVQSRPKRRVSLFVGGVSCVPRVAAPRPRGGHSRTESSSKGLTRLTMRAQEAGVEVAKGSERAQKVRWWL